MEIIYSVGPRYINGVNIDSDSNSTVDIKTREVEIADPVTGIDGLGYQPGQKNKDGSDL